MCVRLELRHVPVVRCLRVWQQGDHSVAQTFTQRTQKLSIFNVVTGVTSKTLLPPLLLQLHSLKVPETHTHTHIKLVLPEWVVQVCVCSASPLPADGVHNVSTAGRVDSQRQVGGHEQRIVMF